MPNLFRDIIEKVCEEKGIKYTYLSKDWIIMLEKDGITRFISGYKFDLNSHAVGEIVDDKYALYEVLKNRNVPVCEYKIIYSKSNNFDYARGCNNYDVVKEYFLKNGQNIVIKQNNGTCGMGVYKVNKLREIDNILDKLFEKNYSVSISPFYNIRNEYRLVMLNGECMIAYVKVLPSVIGDGKKSLKQLLEEFNFGYFSCKLENKKYDKILKKGEVFKYGWKFNLSQGSISKKVTDKKLLKKLINISQLAAKSVNLKFGSVDIIELEDGKLLVLEINSGVMFENYIMQNPDDLDIIKGIYGKAIEYMFL